MGTLGACDKDSLQMALFRNKKNEKSAIYYVNRNQRRRMEEIYPFLYSK